MIRVLREQAQSLSIYTDDPEICVIVDEPFRSFEHDPLTIRGNAESLHKGFVEVCDLHRLSRGQIVLEDICVTVCQFGSRVEETRAVRKPAEIVDELKLLFRNGRQLLARVLGVTSLQPIDHDLVIAS